MNITREMVRIWLQCLEANKEFHFKQALDGNYQPSDLGMLRKMFHDFVKEKLVKPCGRKDGWYKVIPKVEPVKWWEADEKKYYDLLFPCGRGDGGNQVSTFGFEQSIGVSPGDLIVMAGQSNSGKTTLALNFLAENLLKHSCVLMGNEYATLDGRPSPKLKRRMLKMKWASWQVDGKSKFDIIPVSDCYEDYIVPDKINILDWISTPEGMQVWEIGWLIQKIKKAVGQGVAIICLQKNSAKEFGEGGEPTERFADVYFKLDQISDDESRLRVGKVKEPLQKIMGKQFYFRIVDSGANIADITEIFSCQNCRGRGRLGSDWKGWSPCEKCDAKGFIKKEQQTEYIEEAQEKAEME